MKNGARSANPYATPWTQEQIRNQLSNAQMMYNNLIVANGGVTMDILPQMSVYEDRIAKLTNVIAKADKMGTQNVAAPMSEPEGGSYDGDNSGYEREGYSVRLDNIAPNTS